MRSPERDRALDALWLAALQQVVNRAAHEIRDSLNGVSLNVEVLRSRTAKDGLTALSLAPFAEAASGQLELVTARTESLLTLARPGKTGGSADVAVILRHLGTLLVPAAQADGAVLVVEGVEGSVPTSARETAVRLALAGGLLALIKEGGTGRCRLDSGKETVVRFSHESAGACSLDAATVAAVAEHDIRTQRSDRDLLMVFPGS
jgi:signal transduction histidine kinase